MNKALISLLKNTKALNVRSPDHLVDISPPVYTMYMHTSIDMYSDATVVVIPPKKTVHLLNSLAPEKKVERSFLQ